MFNLDNTPLPRYRVTVGDQTAEISGRLELDRGCLIFKTYRGTILKFIAAGHWSEVTLLQDEKGPEDESR